MFKYRRYHNIALFYCKLTLFNSLEHQTHRCVLLTVLEAKVSLLEKEWQKHPIVTGPEALCILAIDYLRRGPKKDPEGYWWAFGISALETQKIKHLCTLPGLLEIPSVLGFLRVEEQLIATTIWLHNQHKLIAGAPAAISDVLIISHFHNLAKTNTIFLQWWK